MALEIFKLFGSIFVDNSAANDSIQKTDKKAEGLGNTFVKGVETVGKWGKALVDASVVAGTAMAAFSAKAVSEYAGYEQAIGGVETLFKESADKVIANAESAYKNAGMSATEYMETVTGFSASLLQSVGGDTETAAEIADMAIVDMSDNANKMGTSIEAIQSAYSGFAKQNYTMLDNLKLGYGGTKSEMERLLADAEKVSGVKYDINNLKDVYNAIHVIQGELDITGTTAKEATTTLEGSMTMIKNKIDDMITDFGGELAPVVQEVLTYVTDMLPEIEAMFEEFVPVIADFVQQLLPQVMNFVQEFFPILMNAIQQLLPVFMQVITIVTELAIQFLPVILDLAMQLIPPLMQIIQAILPPLVSIINTLLPPFMQLVQSLMPLLLSTLDVVLPLLEPIAGLLAPIVELLNLFLEPLVKLLNELLPPIIELIAAFVAVLTEDLGVCLEAITIFADDTFGKLDGLGEDIKEIFAFIPEFFGKLFSNAWENIKNVFKPWAEFFGGLWDTITEIFHKVGTTIADAISGSVKSAVNTVLDGAIGIINGFIGAINKAISIINKIPKVHISKIDKIEIPPLATGGEISGQGSAIVGEAGAELIDLPQGAKVTPLTRASGQGGSVEQKIDQMVMLLQELVATMPEAVAEGVQTLQWQWNDRELGRMVKAYE